MKEKLITDGLRRREKVIFDYVFNYYYSSLCAFAMQYVNDKSSVEDLVQDFFLSFWADSPNLQINVSLKTYLFASIKNRCLDYQKHSKVKEKYKNYVLFAEKTKIIRSIIFLLKQNYGRQLKKVSQNYRLVVAKYLN